MFKIENLLIKISSKYIGEDEFGNKYFVSKFKDSYDVNRRRVVYKGIAEPSKIPPMWHAWLHYVIDEVPVSINYKWQKKHTPNLTGSGFSYKPKNLKNPELFEQNKIYEPWQPNKEG